MQCGIRRDRFVGMLEYTNVNSVFFILGSPALVVARLR